MSGAIATRDNLKKRHIVESGLCSLCNQVDEDFSHAVFYCPTAARVWEDSRFMSLLSNAPHTTFKENVGWLLTKLELKEITNFFIRAWAAWTIRNEQIFKDLTPNPSQLVTGFMRLLVDFNKFARCVFMRKTNGGTPSSTSWHIPPPGVMKINTDACISSDGWIGLGAVMRDDSGRLKAAVTYRMEARVSPAEAEAMAARYGL